MPRAKDAISALRKLDASVSKDARARKDEQRKADRERSTRKQTNDGISALAKSQADVATSVVSSMEKLTKRFESVLSTQENTMAMLENIVTALGEQSRSVNEMAKAMLAISKTVAKTSHPAKVDVSYPAELQRPASSMEFEVVRNEAGDITRIMKHPIHDTH